MNAQQLADYLINHDMESAIVNRQYDLIDEIIQAEGLNAGFKPSTFATMQEAVELANQDPYIIEMATKLTK